MLKNNPRIVTNGLVGAWDAQMPNSADAGGRLYNEAGLNSSDIKLLIHGNDGDGSNFRDSSLSNHAITAGGDVTHSTADMKFSGGSIKFDSDGDYLSIPDSADWDFGNGDFTIDFWLGDPTDTGLWAEVIGQGWTSGSDSWVIGIDWQNNNKMRLAYTTNGSTDIYGAWTSEINTDGGWAHYAFVRYGTTLTNYVNGVADGTHTIGTSTIYASDKPLYIGQRQTSVGSFDYVGYMDEVRITKGAALWTTNFTPPARRDTLSITDALMHNGTCFDFDGTDDKVQTSHNPISGTGDFTLTAWINIASFAGSNFICGNYGSGNANGLEFYVLPLATYNKTLRLHIHSGKSSVTSLSENRWYHVAATRTSGSVQLYIDGKPDGTASALAGSIDTGLNFSIGNGPDYTSENMEGIIADVKAFDVALSAANIKELYSDSKVIIPSGVSQTNLKGWWPMAEGAGDFCYDGSGNGYNGLICCEDGDEWKTGQIGCPQLVEGYNRKAVFEDSNDYVLADNAGITGNISVSAWIYREDHTLTYAGIVAKMGNSTGSGDGWMFRFDSSHNLEFVIQRNGSYTGEGTASVSLKTWHHVVGTNDGTNIKVYVDGSLATTVSSGGATTDSGYKVQIGTYGYATSNPPPNTYPFYGIVDEVIIYNSALTLAQVQALATTGPNGGPLPPDPMSLDNSSDIKGYWRNDGNDTWRDRSGSGNTATVYGSPDAALFKQGYNGQKSTSAGRDYQGFPLLYENNGAVGFNASNTYVDIGYDKVFSESAFTVLAWVRSRNTTPGGGASNIQNIVGHGTNNVGHFCIYTDGKLGIWSYGGSAWRFSNTPLTSNKWHHVVLTFDGDDGAFYYLDGVADSAELEFGGTAYQKKCSVRYFGAQDPSRYFNGQIGNVQIYNRDLSLTEIQQNYKSQRSRFNG